MLKLKRWVLVLRRGGYVYGGGWLFAFWEVRVRMGKKKEKQRRRESAECGYIDFYWWNQRWTRHVGIPVDNSDGEQAMSLYGDPSLNPSVILSVKSSEKISCHQTVSFFQNSIYSISNSISIYQRNYSVSIYGLNCRQNICRQ